MDKALSTREIIPGISGFVSAPTTYSMVYANGTFEYTEKFAVINISAQYTGNASKQLDVIIKQAAAALGAVGNAIIPGIGLALIPLAELGMNWLKDLVFNPDGSITIQLAYHYLGTSHGGFDPTFVPFGLPTDVWNGIVNSISTAISLMGGKFDNVESLNIPEPVKSNDNRSDAVARPGIEIVKSLYAQSDVMESLLSKGNITPTKQELERAGVPVLGTNEDFQQFLQQSVSLVKERNPNITASSETLTCFAYKTAAYTAGAAIVAMGAIAVAELTVSSAIVVELAAALGITARLAHGYILAAAEMIQYGVSVVVQEICGAAGCC